jgi:sodium-dependent dicarboxylate transporter 2/3/5
MNRENMGLLAGLALFVLSLWLPMPESMTAEARRVMAVAVLMATWWITEAVPIPITALLPIVLFPSMGVMSAAEVTAPYANHIIYLFLGGFLIAVTIEKWQLHNRIALHTVRLTGTSSNRVILGFMLATAMLSMWISNTATTMMMMTIGLAVIREIARSIDADPELHINTCCGEFRFGIALMLGIAYAASIGGIATLIGSPPNAIMAGVVENTFGVSISFLDWMLFSLPLSMVMLVVTWLYLTRIAYPPELPHLPGSAQLISQQLQALGPMSRQEQQVLGIFLTVALLWILRGFIRIPFLALVTDSTIAMAGAIIMFMIPVNLKKREFLLDWQTATRIPWDILILFGGGFALARGFSDSGLTGVIASQLVSLQGSDVFFVIAAVTTVVIFLTEITSNTATASLFLPILAALGMAMQIHPFALMLAATLAASCAFMLPVATPPNAIVFSSRYVSIPQMARAGIWINLIAIVLITLLVYGYLPVVWNIDISHIPEGLQLRN